MYRLVRTTTPLADGAAARQPQLDAAQQAVVDHPGGPLLVLAGPGTGKTTTLVESVVARIEQRGQTPDSILVLTFSRRAAADLRTRIAARLGRTVVTPMAMTFHAFCYALVRRFGERLGAENDSGATSGASAPVRLLTGPEQDFRVRETLQGSLETSRADWPDSLARAFPTRAFASEVRAVLAKARQLGMDPDDVIAAGHAAGRSEWVSIGEFFEEYLDVLDAEGVLDYAELVHRSRILLTDPEVVATLRREIGCVFVDEYQDTDPAQVRLLQTVAGDGADVVVVGDPDQSIYAFRGAEARGILDFPELFRTREGAPAPVLALQQTRRFGPGLLAASRSVASRLGMPRSLPPEVHQAFRHPRPDPTRPRGRVEVLTCTSAGAEAEHIAEILRAAHLRDGLPWEEMAVLVRSGRTSIPPLARALVAAGVPVEVAGDEIPLSADPAVRPLLLALQLATRSRVLGPEEAQLLLTSPLGGLDAMATRRLGRALRQAERAELAGTAMPRPSTELLALALRQPELLAECDGGDDAVAAGALAALLHRCERAVADGSTAEEVLWLLWSRTGWPDRLRRESAYGGDTGRRANRDLDAVCALFDIAARSEEVAGLRGVTGFLAEVEGQQIPADTVRESELRGGGVRVLTAHRSKGLEWELVVVAGVQEGTWPDVRRRGTLLEADRLGRRGVSEAVPTAQRIAEERRLFYVACTRARSRLVVTAVAGTEGEGDQPSRFLTELGVPVQLLPGRPRQPLSLAALVGELRRVSVDPETPPPLREQAALRLARLADATGPDSRPLVPAAQPAAWWGMRELTRRTRAGGRPRGGGPVVRQPAGQRPGLPAAVVPGPAGPRGAGPQHRRQLRLAGARARRARGSDLRPPGALGAPGRGLEPARLRRQLAVRGGTGGGGVGPGAVRGLAGRPPPPAAARDGGGVHLRRRARRRARSPHRHRRPGGARPRRPGPDRRLQDLPGRARSRRRRAAGPARRLPAGRAGRRLRRRRRAGCAARRRRAGLPAPSGRRHGPSQGVPAGVPGRRALPRRAPRERGVRTSRPGCTSGSPKPPRSSARSGSRRGSARPAVTVRSAAAVRPSPSGQQVVA